MTLSRVLTVCLTLLVECCYGGEKLSYPSGKPNIVTDLFELQTGDVVTRALLTHNLFYSILRPVVLIVPDYTGKPNQEIQQAIKWAEKGYVGCAVDLFHRWDSSTNATLDDLTLPTTAPLPPFPHANRSKLVEQLTAILTYARGFDTTYIDRNKAAAMGFGIGGTLVLDLARSGAVLDGVVSFRGELSQPPGGITKPPITAKVLVHSYYDDTNVPSNTIEDFEREMTGINADWQLVMYGKGPAPVPKFRQSIDGDGFLTGRALTATKDFFTEIFGEENLASEPLGLPRTRGGKVSLPGDPSFSQTTN